MLCLLLWLWDTHPRTYGTEAASATATCPFAAVVEAQSITIFLDFLFITAGVKGSWGCWALMGMLGPDGEAPALYSLLLHSHHGPTEGKPSLGVAVGFYNPENESQHHPCLSGEQSHVTAQETIPWERQLVKERKKPKGAGLVWGWELGRGKAGSGCASCMLPAALNTCLRFFPSSGVGPQCFGGISLHVGDSEPTLYLQSLGQAQSHRALACGVALV